jgi:hypothetical protein
MKDILPTSQQEGVYFYFLATDEGVLYTERDENKNEDHVYEMK